MEVANSSISTTTISDDMNSFLNTVGRQTYGTEVNKLLANIFAKFGKLSIEDKQEYIVKISQMIMHIGNMKDGQRLTNVFCHSIMYLFRQEPEVAIKLLPAVEKAQYGKIFFTLLRLIIVEDLVDESVYGVFKAAILQYLLGVVRKIKDGVEAYKIAKIHDPEAVIPKELLSLIGQYNCYLPRKKAAEMGNASGNVNKKRKDKKTAAKGELLKMELQMQPHLFSTGGEFVNHLRKIKMLMEQIEFVKRDIQKQRFDDMCRQQSLQLAETTANEYGGIHGFKDFFETSEFAAYMAALNTLKAKSISFVRMHETKKCSAHNSAILLVRQMYQHHIDDYYRTYRIVTLPNYEYGKTSWLSSIRDLGAQYNIFYAIQYDEKLREGDFLEEKTEFDTADKE